MVKYFAYYSFAGYKDLYLGKSTDHAEATYYTPKIDLSSIDDGELKRQLEENLNKLADKPAISDSPADVNIPYWTQVVGGNTAYWVALVRNADDCYSIILRKLNGVDRDELGRNVPFVFYLLVDNARDAERLFAYIQHNFQDLDGLFGNLLHYDAEYNALKFELAKADRIVDEALVAELAPLNLLMSRQVPAAIFGSYMEYANFEDRFGRNAVGTAYDTNGNIIAMRAEPRPEEPEAPEEPTMQCEDREDRRKINTILETIKFFFTVTEEDKADLRSITNALCNIGRRRRHRNG